MEWFYEKDGAQQGPVAEDALKALVATGDLRSSNLVWREGMGDWAAYASVFPQAAIASAPMVEATPRAFTDVSASGFRREAREALEGNWLLSVLTTFLYQLLQQIAMAIPLLGLIAPLLVTGPLSLGYYAYLQGVVRREPVEVGTLFDGFQRWGQGIGIFFVTSIIILFASGAAAIPGGAFLGYAMSETTNVGLQVVAFCCMLIPAILVGLYFWLRYSMVYFIANDHPDFGALDVMKLSSEMMDGHKIRLLFLSLTFTGWFILGFLAFVIGALWASTYMLVAFAAFYDELRSRQSS